MRGEIVYQRSMSVTAGILTTLHISVTPQMSPSARLFVYYLRQAGGSTEVVDDSVWIDIKDECRNKVWDDFIYIDVAMASSNNRWKVHAGKKIIQTRNIRGQLKIS